MCGIAGFYGFKNDDLIKRISRQLSHRGPDGEGLYVDNEVTLLNRRLAIIDIKGGNQPIYNEDKSLVVVYNGEIYNYQELKKELQAKGHKFATKSDTEIIVHGYEEWGMTCFDKFNGMFGIALYDKKEKKLMLVRDHFGIKPLYYAIIGTKIIFSSEIKPIFYSGLIKKNPNDRIIYRYLRYRIHDDNEETFFEGIKRLLPGQMMAIQNGKIKIKNYTKMKEELLRLSERPTVNRVGCRGIDGFRKELIRAVRYRLISDVPVGTCLSGGIDSSTIVAVVNKLLKEKTKEAKSVGDIQKTFSAVFPGSINDEEKYINELVESRKLKVESHKIKPRPEDFFNEIEDFVRTQEEPTISTGPYAQYKVMQEAHKYVTVLLDGQGSDEMMAGYLPYYFVYLRELLNRKNYLEFVKETFSSWDVVSKYIIQVLWLKTGFKKNIKTNELLNKEFAEKYRDEKFIVNNHNLKERLIEDIFANSLQSLLRYEDRNTMRFSIEGRVPFLDFNLIQYIFNLDNKAIIKNGWNKYILRQSVKDLLPGLIVNRRNKIGFTTPEEEWFLHMKNRIYSIFMSDSFGRRKYFNQQEVLKAFQKFIEGKTDDSMIFWRLLNVEMWLRIFFPTPSEKSADLASDKVNKPIEMFHSNPGKKLEIQINDNRYLRFPIKTEIFKKGDDYAEKIASNVLRSIDRSQNDKNFNKLLNNRFFVVVSEKIVAISQGRSYFIWDIKPGFFAKFLSKFVRRTPYGIGLGSPWTMQLAINEVGLARILAASVASLVTKPFGIKGIFYHIAGRESASIDGPTEYSLYPSNVSAKLGPKNPDEAAKKIQDAIAKLLNGYIAKNFLGVAIIDANDLGQNVLGNSTNLESSLIEKIFKDNPMGQSSEQTPVVLVFENT